MLRAYRLTCENEPTRKKNDEFALYLQVKELFDLHSGVLRANFQILNVLRS